MNKINQIGKFFVILFTVAIIATTVVAECYQLNQNSQPTTGQDPDSEDNEGTAYIQAFDVVAQNVQLNLLSPIVPCEASFNIIESARQIITTTYKAGSIRFFNILFRQIISPNAP